MFFNSWRTDPDYDIVFGINLSMWSLIIVIRNFNIHRISWESKSRDGGKSILLAIEGSGSVDQRSETF